MPIRCPSCGSKNTQRSPISDYRKFTFRECIDCGYTGKWVEFRVQKGAEGEMEYKIQTIQAVFREYIVEAKDGEEAKHLILTDPRVRADTITIVDSSDEKVIGIIPLEAEGR